MKKLVLALAALAFCCCVSVQAALWGNCCEKSCKKERSEKKDCNRCGACPMKKACGERKCEKKCERSCKPKCEKSCKKDWCGKKSCPKEKCGTKSCCKTGCNKKMRNDDMMEESDR